MNFSLRAAGAQVENGHHKAISNRRLPMKEFRYSSIGSRFSKSIKIAAILCCAMFLGSQTIWAQSVSDAKQDDINIVVQKGEEKKIPGSYHYQSRYEMTTDGKGTYRSTYESQKDEWFCCMNWFYSKNETSSKANRP